MKSQRGFTLVEILVVLIIIVILVTMLGGKILGAGDKAKADLNFIRMKDLQNSIEQYRLRYSLVPASLEELTRCSEKTGPGCVPITNEDALKDAWGGAFLYTLENGGRAYRIKSFGADQREGGEGVNFDNSVVGP